MNGFGFNYILKKFSNQFLCYFICIMFIGLFILIMFYKSRCGTIDTPSSLVISNRILGSQNGFETTLQNSESKRTSDDILFKLQAENIVIPSHIRAADRKSSINKMINMTKLSGQYRYNGTYTSLEKAEISSKCMSIYPFNEDESHIVERSNYQVVQLQTPYGNTPIALHGRGDALSSWLRAGSPFEPQITEGLLSALKTDPQLALFDFGAMLGV